MCYHGNPRIELVDWESMVPADQLDRYREIPVTDEERAKVLASHNLFYWDSSPEEDARAESAVRFQKWMEQTPVTVVVDSVPELAPEAERELVMV